MHILDDVRATIAPAPSDPHGPLAPILLVLTAVTGIVDAVSYLRLGHVFVANMTGNIVFLGFGLAGARDVSVPLSAIALLAFAAGAFGGGRLIGRTGGHRGRLIVAMLLVDAGLVAGAAGLAWAGGVGPGVDLTAALISVLSITMGIQNAAARKIGVPDLTTTVLTLTITGLGADARLAGGPGARPGRRLLAVGAMLLGAGLGATLVLHFGVAATLGAAAVVLGTTGAVAARYAKADAAWTGLATGPVAATGGGASRATSL